MRKECIEMRDIVDMQMDVVEQMEKSDRFDAQLFACGFQTRREQDETYVRKMLNNGQNSMLPVDTHARQLKHFVPSDGGFVLGFLVER